MESTIQPFYDSVSPFWTTFAVLLTLLPRLWTAFVDFGHYHRITCSSAMSNTYTNAKSRHQPIHAACGHDRRVVAILLDHGANVGEEDEVCLFDFE